jgi:CHASE2 domain-containing sensor protein
VISAASEPLSRSLAQRGGLIRVLHSPALKALVGANIIVAAIILARSNGWLQPFELLIYDALRVVWAGHEPSNRIFLVGGTEDDVTDFDWPLRDGELADLLERLASWNPRVIGVDIYRDKPKPSGLQRFSPGTKKLSGSSSSRRVQGGRYYPRKCFAAPSAPFLPISYLTREM